ncbi:fosfomycin resistance glutathione transferase [Pseudoalteromonas sp. T1lg65]|uniref:fosfomycin resistance glutathione transferase n=1 Tax=Pseudoalteromonas sp. T1lg65 TaxID=2077101 RepID=UPI003F79F529
MLKGLNHITIAVSDLSVSIGFYNQVLGFELLVSWDKGAYLRSQDVWLCLSHGNTCPAKDYTHIAFTIEQSDLNNILPMLTEQNVKIWKRNTSEGDSIYLLDPDGHQLELHCGDLKSRLESLKTKPYKDLIWHQEVD